MTLADGFEAIRSYKTSGNPDEAEDLPTYIDGKISSYTGFVKTNYNNEGTKYVNLVNTGLSFRSLTSATAEPQGAMTLNDGGWVEFSGDLGGTDYQGNASITLSNGFDSIQAYGTDEGGSNQTISDFMAVSSNIYQLKRPVTGTAIELVKNRSYYTKTITSNTTLSITVPAAPPYSSGNSQVNWDNIAITFEIELNVKNNNLTIGYPWTWIDDFLAPDLSKAGCYTIAIRGNRRNGTWKWRANLQDTEPAF